MDEWLMRGVTRNSAEPADWQWMHRTDERVEISAGAFPTLEACIEDAQRHGFESDDRSSGFSWTAERGLLTGLYRPRARRASTLPTA